MKNLDRRPSLFIAEDETSTREAYTYLLSPKYKIQFATSCKEALKIWKKKTFDIAILDVNLPDGLGIDILKRIRSNDAQLPVIMCSATKQIESVVEAMKRGATDFLTKPINKELLLHTLKKIEETRQLQWERDALLEKVKLAQEQHHGIIGASSSMRHVLKLIKKLTGTEMPVILYGESGVGKEVIAHAIHQQEKDPLRPFIVVNCAAIPENLLESELFGHEKSAFPGATKRIGKFVQANGGDLFLDEVACMPPPLQGKLLRVLQDKIVEPLGSKQRTHVNFRVIAATNQDLQKAIRHKQFREDLFYRLQGVEIRIPPLRGRVEDIPPLITHFLKELAPQFGLRRFTGGAIKKLMKYPWPGNVRELKNTLSNILILNRNETLSEKHLPLNIGGTIKLKGVYSHLRSHMKDYEKEMIVQALKQYGGNKSRTSKELGIPRSILYRKIKMLSVEDTEN